MPPLCCLIVTAQVRLLDLGFAISAIRSVVCNTGRSGIATTSTGTRTKAAGRDECKQNRSMNKEFDQT
ncbi:hypothetical protein BSFP_014630 [Burkholderia stabilis]|uniref:Uncharacterized protein n=1 Tax=Burkholderia stabilis TaxID=95485 RepID=A0A1Y1BHP6_9BURK|nr:hypothetical protein BSFP_014630 [Burkholderia stabilis]